MALEKGTQSLPFTQGLDTKSNQHLSAKPSLLQNGVFRDGTISKRWGRAQLSDDIFGGGTQDEGEALFTFGAFLHRLNGGVTYGLTAATDEWVPMDGGGNYCNISIRSIASNCEQGFGFDHCIVGNYGVVAWLASGIHVAVYDMRTGVYYQTGAAAIASSSLNAILPRLVALGQKVIVLWRVANELYSAVVNLTSLGTLPTQTMIRNDLTNSGTFDAIAYNPALAVCAYQETGAINIRLIGIDTAGLVTASPATVSVNVGAAVQEGLLVQRDTAGNIYVVFSGFGTFDTKYFVRNGSFGAVLGVTDIVLGGNWNSGDANFYSGVAFEETANVLTLVLGRGGDITSVNQFLGTAKVNALGIVSAFTTIDATAGLSIVGDAVLVDGVWMLGVVNTSYGQRFVNAVDGLETSAYVITPDGQVVAKALMYRSNVLSEPYPRVSRSFVDGNTGRFVFPQQGKPGFQIVGDLVLTVSKPTISRVDVTFTPANLLPIHSVGKTIYIGGGYPRVFDGVRLGETGFQLSPSPTLVNDAGAGGSLSAGTYQYRFCYSWMLANGELTRGIVSPAVSITLAASHSVAISIATMPLAMRDVLIAGTNSSIEVYRTTANGSVFYRQSSVLTGPVNVTSSPSAIAFIDNTADSVLQLGEILYTTGGILDWEAPPAYFAACTHNNRLIICPSEDPFSWMPSSEWVINETVRFSDITTNHIPSDAGQLVNCASMDGKLILFTASAAYVVIGNGPDRLGNNNYPPPERVASVDAGPIPKTPIVETPLGLMYQSDRGIVLLDRGLNMSFIGADVETYSTGPWVAKAALLDASAQQVRFLLDDGSDLPGTQMGTLVPSNGGISLVYDYFYQQWSVFPNYGGQDSCLYSGRYTMVRSDGVVWQEEPDTFRDEGEYYSTLVETPWIKLAGIQGFQRIWYAIVLGTYASDFTLTWETAVNYASTDPTLPIWTETVTLDGASEFTLGGQYEVRHHLGHKCVSVKFRFTDSDLRGSGEGMALSDLTLEYGVKKGAWKLGASKTA